MVDVIMLIFKGSIFYVVIFLDVFFIVSGLPFFMVFDLDIT